MNVTFLVGNGFDIACGIDTSYNAFYNWYLKQPSSSEAIHYLKKDIKRNWENWSDFEMGLAYFTRNFSSENIKEFFDCYNDAQNNIINFLKLQMSKFDYNLIDENTIFEFKKNIISFYKELPSAEERKINEIIGMREIKYNFISFNYTQILNKLAELSSKEAIKEQNKANNLIAYKIFNPNVINVHGSLTKSPILGVSEEHQILNKELIKEPFFSQVMIKSHSVNAIGESWYNDTVKLIENSNIICIFGMSLGDSDSFLWEKIAIHLNNTPNCYLIIFWHTDTPPSNISIYDTLVYKDNIKDLIVNNTAMTKEEIKKVKNQIYVVFNTKKVLNITLSHANKKDEKDLLHV